MMNALVYLDSYTLQSDLRIRLPKSAITNLNAIPGQTRFSFFYDSVNNAIVMQICHFEKNKKLLNTIMIVRIKND